MAEFKQGTSGVGVPTPATAPSTRPNTIHAASPCRDLQRPQFDATKLDRAAVVLQAEVAAGTAAPVAAAVGGREELACLDVGDPAVAVDVIGQQFFAVEPVFHVLAAGHDAGLVPLADGTRGV